MDRRHQQQTDEAARQRALALGKSADPNAVPELLRLCAHRRPLVRKLAASALGKLAEDEVAGVGTAMPTLCRLTCDPHPQVRQYAMKALAKLADEAAMPALRDVANRPAEPEYNLRTAMLAIAAIEQAAANRQALTPAACARCGRQTTPAEHDLAMRQFQRPYCDACFNAVFVERRNFDMKVQNQKTIVAADRTVVQSQGERCIAGWLGAHAIVHRYDDKFQLIQGYAIRPDFYLPELDLYIEYWGLDTTDYRIGMLLKQKLYQQQGKRLLSLFPADLPALDAKLTAALHAHGYTPLRQPVS